MKPANIFYYLFGSVIFIFSQTVLANSIIDDAEDLELGENYTFCSDDHCSTYLHLGEGKIKQRFDGPLQQIVLKTYSSQSLLCGELDTSKITLVCEETESTINCVKTAPGERGECLFEQLVNIQPTGSIRYASAKEGEGEGEVEEVQEYIRVVLSDTSKREVFCNHASCVEVIREVRKEARKVQSFSHGVNGYEPIAPHANSNY